MLINAVSVSGLVCFTLYTGCMLVEGTRASRSRDEDLDPWQLCSDTPVNDTRFWPTIGNGHIGTVVYSDTVFMNGLYNGNGTQTKRARIPAMIAFELDVSLPVRTRQYCLYLKDGMYTEKLSGDHWSVELHMFAHRSLTRLLVTDLHVRTDGEQRDLVINLRANHGNESADINFKNGSSHIQSSRYMYGTTKTPETPSSGTQSVYVIYTEMPDQSTIRVKHGNAVLDHYRYMMSVSPFEAEAVQYYRKGLKLGGSTVSHVTAWHELWDRGRVDIHGNAELAASAYSALYYMFSSMPSITDTTWPFIGLSPGDLGHGNKPEEYGGHLFWDQDTWMFPPILCLHDDLAKILVNTRIRTLDAAYENAKLSGHSGARYPWECALSGYEVTPSLDCSMYEHHVTGDVALGFRQYLQMTNDTDLLLNGRLHEAILGMADFWKSRVVFNSSSNLYEIHEVMPPDEWSYPVNNSAYTNTVARLSLQLPAFTATLLGGEPDPSYESIASKMYIPLDRDLQYHPEYDGYTTNLTVKQADVVMLGFPLMSTMTEAQRRNDLTQYEKVTPGGPAMTWAIFSIGWLELKQYRKAEELFRKQLLNKQPPFNVWTEYADGYGATNFLTGQGGFLQSLLFGYAGIRIYDDHLAVRCSVLPNSDGFSIRHLDYLGNALDISCWRETTDISLQGNGTQLYVEEADTGMMYALDRLYTLRLHSTSRLTISASNTTRITSSAGMVVQSRHHCLWTAICLSALWSMLLI